MEYKLEEEKMDFGILYFLNSLHSPILDKIMYVFTMFGEGGIFWIALSVVLLIPKRTRKCGLLMLISMFIGIIIGNGILKNLVRRDRPCWIDESVELLVKNPKDFSFPSGHTLASFEAAITILLHNKRWGIAAVILAICVGISRMYLFVHFPTDVLAGAVLGTIIAISVYLVSNKIIKSRKKTNETENTVKAGGEN